MIVKFKPKETLYKSVPNEKKRISTASVFYLNTKKRAIKSTTGKDLYLLLARDKNNSFVFASLNTINTLLEEVPFIKGVDNEIERIEKSYNSAYVEATYYGSLKKKKKLQEYNSLYGK